MRWLELKIAADKESSEAVAEKLFALDVAGVAIEDSSDWLLAEKEDMGDIFPASNITDSNEVIIRGYLPLSFLAYQKTRELEIFLNALPRFGLQRAVLTCHEVDDTSWENAWKDYWHPTPVGQKLVIVPAWQDAGPWSGRTVLHLDPGPAFGTGTHESTRLCLELLEENISGGEAIIDLGCGSGILALAAGLLGAGSVLGVDKDETAVRAGRENADLNSLPDIYFSLVDLREEIAWQALPQADIILANLTAGLLISLSVRLKQLLRPNGKIIASGIILGRAGEVAASFQACGCRVAEQRNDGEWVAFLLEMI